MQGLHYPNRQSKSLIRKFHSVELDCQAQENYFDILTIPLCKGEVLRPHKSRSKSDDAELSYGAFQPYLLPCCCWAGLNNDNWLYIDYMQYPVVFWIFVTWDSETIRKPTRTTKNRNFPVLELHLLICCSHNISPAKDMSNKYILVIERISCSIYRCFYYYKFASIYHRLRNKWWLHT